MQSTFSSAPIVWTLAPLDPSRLKRTVRILKDQKAQLMRRSILSARYTSDFRNRSAVVPIWEVCLYAKCIKLVVCKTFSINSNFYNYVWSKGECLEKRSFVYFGLPSSFCDFVPVSMYFRKVICQNQIRLFAEQQRF